MIISSIRSDFSLISWITRYFEVKIIIKTLHDKVWLIVIYIAVCSMVLPKTDCHDITEILLKVTLNTIIHVEIKVLCILQLDVFMALFSISEITNYGHFLKLLYTKKTNNPELLLHFWLLSVLFSIFNNYCKFCIPQYHLFMNLQIRYVPEGIFGS